MARLIVVAFACLVLASGSASAALTAPEIGNNINFLTIKATSLSNRAATLSIRDGVLLAANGGNFPLIIDQLSDIVQTGEGDLRVS
jgi:hypothetical protein